MNSNNLIWLITISAPWSFISWFQFGGHQLDIQTPHQLAQNFFHKNRLVWNVLGHLPTCWLPCLLQKSLFWLFMLRRFSDMYCWRRHSHIFATFAKMLTTKTWLTTNIRKSKFKFLLLCFEKNHNHMYFLCWKVKVLDESFRWDGTEGRELCTLKHY